MVKYLVTGRIKLLIIEDASIFFFKKYKDQNTRLDNTETITNKSWKYMDPNEYFENKKEQN